MGKAISDNGDCRLLHEIQAVLREQLDALDTCGSSLASAHLSQALEALEKDLRNRCGKRSDARQGSSGRAEGGTFGPN